MHVKTIYAFVKKGGAISAAATKAFAGIQTGDGVAVGAGKVALAAIKRTVYTVADYWLAALCAAANIALKARGVELLYAFLVMWFINIVIAAIFLGIYLKTGQDLSLGKDLRRAVDAIYGQSRFAGYLSLIGVLLQAAVWSGPEQCIIFFRKEIGGTIRMVIVLFFLTAIQTSIWMYLYRTGYHMIAG